MTNRKIVQHNSPEKVAAWRKRMRLMHRLGREPEVGDIMHDGSVFAGMSPDTGKRLFVMRKDALSTQFNKAADYLQQINQEKALGHNDWRLPTLGELRVMFDARNSGALSGTFNSTHHATRGWYWSATLRTGPDGRIHHWQKNFLEGTENFFDGSFTAVSRFVRS